LLYRNQQSNKTSFISVLHATNVMKVSNSENITTYACGIISESN